MYNYPFSRLQCNQLFNYFQHFISFQIFPSVTKLCLEVLTNPDHERHVSQCTTAQEHQMPCLNNAIFLRT
uniref:Uncharacterized protein n=1 Tax=Arundo donax TaxID=35708 RepID=A0A0A8YGV3_ARUDO